LHHNKHTFVYSYKQYHNFHSWSGGLVGIPFGIHLTHNVFVNSLAMTSSLPTLMHKDMFEYLMPYIDILKLGVIICWKTMCEDSLNLFFQSCFFFGGIHNMTLMPQLWQDPFFFTFLVLNFHPFYTFKEKDFYFFWFYVMVLTRLQLFL